MKQLTERQFVRLNLLLKEAQGIEADEKRISERKDANRAAIAELIREAGLVNAEDRTAAPGVVVQSKRGVKYSPDTALNWALAPENFPTAAPMLSVRRDSMAAVIALAMMDDKLKAVFELYKPGYESAVREQTHVGIPFEDITENEIISISLKNVKTGTELREQFEIVIEEEAEPVSSNGGVPF